MLNQLKNILTNPIGIGLAVLHWSVALSALSFIPVDNFRQVPDSGETAMLLLIALFVLDIPSIAVAALAFSPLYFLHPISEPFLSFFWPACFAVVTFQWLLIGRAIYNFFWRGEAKIANLGITGKTFADNLDSTGKTELK